VLDTLLETLFLTLLLVVPFAALTAAGVLLWRHWRSVATAMIALGFAVTLLSVASGLFAAYKTYAVLSDPTSAFPAQQGTFFFVSHYHRVPLIGVLGMWAAAAGTLWHVKRHR